MIPIKDNYKFFTDPTMEDQIRRTNNWIYKNKKSILDRHFGTRGAADRGVESQRWSLSEYSGFNSYPIRPEVYLVKNVVR